MRRRLRRRIRRIVRRGRKVKRINRIRLSRGGFRI